MFTNDHPWMSIDVESVGLYGDPFQVGWIIFSGDGKQELESGFLACPLSKAVGLESNRKWVEENVLPATQDEGLTSSDPDDLCQAFWEIWINLKKKYPGIIVIADVPIPVEARFFDRCVRLDESARQWEAPFPLIDIASSLAQRGYDPSKDHEREENELPKHNPVSDARQSARLFFTLK